MAVRDIEVGDEVVWDYQVRGEVWSGCRLVDGRVQMATDAEVVGVHCSIRQSCVFTNPHKISIVVYEDYENIILLL